MQMCLAVSLRLSSNPEFLFLSLQHLIILSFSPEVPVESFAHSFTMYRSCIHSSVVGKGSKKWIIAKGTRLGLCPTQSEDTSTLLIEWSVWHLSRAFGDHSGIDAHPGQICKHQLNLHGETHCHLLWQKKPPGHIPAVTVTSVTQNLCQISHWSVH